jgi:hypothetical protein
MGGGNSAVGGDVGELGPLSTEETSKLDESSGMDYWLDNLETLISAIAQRRMTNAQRSRYARLINRAQRDVLARQYRSDPKEPDE